MDRKNHWRGIKQQAEDAAKNWDAEVSDWKEARRKARIAAEAEDAKPRVTSKETRDKVKETRRLSALFNSETSEERAREKDWYPTRS